MNTTTTPNTTSLLPLQRPRRATTRPAGEWERIAQNVYMSRVSGRALVMTPREARVANRRTQP